jgi:hypothetical protein
VNLGGRHPQVPWVVSWRGSHQLTGASHVCWELPWLWQRVHTTTARPASAQTGPFNILQHTTTQGSASCSVHSRGRNKTQLLRPQVDLLGDPGGLCSALPFNTTRGCKLTCGPKPQGRHDSVAWGLETPEHLLAENCKCYNCVLKPGMVVQICNPSYSGG